MTGSGRTAGRRRRRWAVVALFVAGATAGGVAVVRRTSSEESILAVYRAAGRQALAGADPYAARNQVGLGFLYPPPAALLMAPLAMLPPAWAALLWYAAGLVLYGLALGAAADLARPLGAGATRRTAVPLLLTLPYATHNFLYGQASLFMVAPALLALAAAARGRPRSAASLFAFGAAVKPPGLVAALDLVARREWRAAAWTAAASTLLVVGLPALVLGPSWAMASLGSFLEVSVRLQRQGEGSSFLNQSLRAALARAGLGEWAAPLQQGIGIGLLAVTLAVIARRPLPRAVSGGLLLSLLPALAATGWKHHFLVLILPYAALAAAWERLPAPARALAALSAAGTLLWSPDLVGGAASRWLQERSIVLWAGLLAWGALLVLALRPGALAGDAAPAPVRDAADVP